MDGDLERRGGPEASSLAIACLPGFLVRPGGGLWASGSKTVEPVFDHVIADSSVASAAPLCMFRSHATRFSCAAVAGACFRHDQSIPAEEGIATVAAVRKVVVPQVIASAVRASSRVVADWLVVRIVSPAQLRQLPRVRRELGWENAVVTFGVSGH